MTYPNMLQVNIGSEVLLVPQTKVNDLITLLLMSERVDNRYVETPGEADRRYRVRGPATFTLVVPISSDDYYGPVISKAEFETLCPKTT